MKNSFIRSENSEVYSFFYKDNVLDTNNKVSLRLKNVTLATFSKRAFYITTLNIKIDDRQVIVKKKAGHYTRIGLIQSYLQESRFYFKRWLPLLILTVYHFLVQVLFENNTTNGTQSGLWWKFSLAVANKMPLDHFHYWLCYTGNTLGKGQSTLNIILQEKVPRTETKKLCRGLRTKPKKDLTGSVSVIGRWWNRIASVYQCFSNPYRARLSRCLVDRGSFSTGRVAIILNRGVYYATGS